MNKQVMYGLLNYAIWLVFLLSQMIAVVHLKTLVGFILAAIIALYSLHKLHKVQEYILDSWGIHLPSTLKRDSIKGETNAT